ncbi:outer membrane protein assembly factor [Planctobacterium marinum]|uniref:Translocation and assembly module subunit TamA n=2 Tax=Planctobacterium marinum TaxID=1631968 RepID=A0AA48HQY9_9ALTE|nr:outer membrane protein assembly factor [Planctobacterium marinum]
MIWLGALLWLQSATAIEIKGRGSIPASVLNNINLHVSVFSSAENCVISNRYRKKVWAAVDTALKAKGYYKANIQSLEPGSKTDCDSWLLEVELGPALLVNSVQIALLDQTDNDPLLRQINSRFPFKTGDKFDHKLYEQWKSDTTGNALLKGYFDFKFERHEVQLRADKLSADIVLEVSIGSRYRFGELINLPDPDDRALIIALRPFQPGDEYDSVVLNQFTEQLKRSGYFTSVFVRPLVSQAIELQVPLEVVYQFKPANEFNIGGGVSSDTGPRAKFSWQRSRLNKAGHSIETELSASFIEQSLAARYRMPLQDPARNFISLQLGLKHTDDNDTQSNILTLAAKRHWITQDDDWQRIAQLRYNRETFTQANAEEQTTSLLLPGITYTRFRSQGGLTPFWGDKQFLSIEGGSKSILSDIDLLRFIAQSRWLRSFGNHQWFARAELGALSSDNFAEVPSSLRFFAGGDQSVRGFGYETLAPIDKDEQLTGGKYLYTVSVEYSYNLVPDWRLALFADAGNAGMSLFDDVATGIGAGVHWITPVGPLRVYLARGNSSLESTWRIHFSLGASL